MVAYVTITDVETDPDAPLTAVLGKKFRDNAIAMSEGSTGAPYLQTAWHPYNGVTVGDGNTGLLYDVAVSGNTATVVTPDFVDGYEYRIRLSSVSPNAAVSTTIEFNLYGETSAAYIGGGAIATSSISAALFSGTVDFLVPRSSDKSHFVQGLVAEVGVTTVSSPQGFVVHNGTAQKILKARMQVGTGAVYVFDAGKFYLYRRRTYE